MRHGLACLKHLTRLLLPRTRLLLPRTPLFRAMSTSPSAAPFSNSCEKLDALIQKLESELGVKEPFDVKKAMASQDKPAVAPSAPAAPQKPAAAATPVAAAAAAGGAAGSSAQDAAAAKPKKEKADKPAAPPKAPPVRSSCPVMFNM